jgi:transcriptional regulator with XRE-family HTH domain
MRKDLGLSKCAFAKLLGVDQSLMGRILAGKRGVGFLTAARIEKASKSWKDGPIYAHEWSCQWHTGVDDSRQGTPGVPTGAPP